MVELINHGVYLLNGTKVCDNYEGLTPDEARENTITYGILRSHDVDGSKGKKMRIRFDAMMSHDITYVGIIQTARASGLEEFPLPYAMTNCHNSLCAVGGTINEDDHVFGLSAAKKYGGIYVPANQAVIHQYAREMMVKCGNMILGSDSHTRYGSLGNMGVGEGGGELVKQLLKNTWDINAPEVVLVWLEGKPKKGVGPHDVAISLVKATFESGVVKNKVLEFAGPGVKELPIDFRNGIDIMTTETTCLSSIWITDEEVKHHYEIHERPQDFKELKPGDVAYYDMMIRIDLSSQEAMIALPFHPSNAVTIHELQADPVGILTRIEEDAKKRFGDKVDVHLVDKVVDGKVYADQGIIAGCSGGTYDNLAEAGAILKGKSIGNDYFTASAYPQSTPVSMAVTREGITADLIEAGVVMKPAFCGPCFGAGDVPSNNGLSIRHTTRNFPTARVLSRVRDSSRSWLLWTHALSLLRLLTVAQSQLLPTWSTRTHTSHTLTTRRYTSAAFTTATADRVLRLSSAMVRTSRTGLQCMQCRRTCCSSWQPLSTTGYNYRRAHPVWRDKFLPF